MSDSDSATNEVYSLRRVTGSDNNQLGTVATEIPLENGEAVYETAGLESGTYVVVDDSGTVQTATDGELSQAGGSSTAERIQNASFTLSDQTISAEFNESQANNQGEDTARDLEIDSNRGNYNVSVSASGLDTDDLAQIFGDSSAFLGTYTDDDGVAQARLSAGTNSDIRANFNDIDASTYNFSLEVDDTGDTAEASVDVLERDSDRNFANSVVTDQAGDVVEVTVELQSTDETYVFIGSDETNVFERVLVQDNNDDGQVTFEVNTFYLGRSPSAVEGMSSIDSTYDSSDDTVRGVERLRQNPTVSENSADGYDSDASEGTIDISANLSDPIESGEYSLVASSSPQWLVNDDDNIEIPNEQDTAVLSLTDGQVSNVQTWVAPRNENIDELDEISESATQRSTVADDDKLVIQMEASGIEGIVDDSSASTYFNNSGLYLIISERSAGANQDPAVMDLTNGNAYEVVEDSNNDTYYLVVDTRAVGSQEMVRGSFDTGQYDVQLALTGDDTDFYDDLDTWFGDSPNSYTSSDYVSSDEIRSASTEFTLENRRAEFTGLNDEDVLEVQQSETAAVSAETNLAPGTSVTVRLSGENSLYSQSVDVSSNGTIDAELDLSGAEVGQNLRAQIRLGGTALTSADAVVAEQTNETTPGTETDTATPTDTPGTSTGTATPETSTPTPQPATETETETTDGDGPGFGAVVALVALLAAALLAVRRD